MFPLRPVAAVTVNMQFRTGDPGEQAQPGVHRHEAVIASPDDQSWRAIGVRFIQVVPEVQIHREQDNAPGTLRVGDRQNRLKSWFAQHNTAIAVVRPDRFVAALAIPQTLGAQLTALAEKMALAIEETAHAEEKVA